MVTYAVVGTGPISQQFVDAASRQNGWRLTGVVGSRLERADQFLASLDAATRAFATSSPDLASLMRTAQPDVVYVATPNSVHFSTVMALLELGMNVIVEKPAFSNRHEWDDAHELARARGVVLVEAARHLFEPNYQTVKQAVASLSVVTGASLVFRQYSARYSKFLEGERPAIFTAKYSGGALADLGVYSLYTAIDLFGMPDEARYMARLLETGIDAEGIALLEYPGFAVSLSISKRQMSTQPSEVYGPDGTAVAFDAVTGIQSARTTAPGAAAVEIPLVAPAANPMVHEVEYFTKLLTSPRNTRPTAPYSVDDLETIGAQVIEISGRLRRSAGIVFDADRR